MISGHSATARLFRTFFLSLLLAMAAPVTAQNARGSTTAAQVMAPDALAVAQFRLQYDTMMSNFERMALKQGNVTAQNMARAGREALSGLNDQQLGMIYSRTKIPDLSVAVVSSEMVASRPARSELKSFPFPGAPAVVSNCDGVDTDAGTRYALFITKEVANALLAAAAWACNEDILGENGSLACIPLAIAADVANGFFDTATFCAGEATANQVDGNYQRLEHMHNDLTVGIATIVNNDNSNKTAIINNDNSNKTAIINNDNANTTTLVTVANANTATIVNNDNANKAALVAEIRALGCEIVRLLNTPDGLKASSILACAAAPGYPFSWNKK